MVPMSEKLRIGIVGSWENGPTANDISLEKFLSTGEVEVYCPWSDYLFSSNAYPATRNLTSPNFFALNTSHLKEDPR